MPSYVALPVPPILAPFVDAIWSFEGTLSHAHERILPSGAMQLLVNLDEDELRTARCDRPFEPMKTRGAAWSGAFASPFVIDTAQQRAIVGVSFKPGGAAPFLRYGCDAIGGVHVEASELWAREGSVLRERLLERRDARDRLSLLASILVERAARPLVVDRAIAFAVDALDRGRAVAEVIDALGWSEKKLLRVFAREVGLSPKKWSRIRRFQRALAAAERARDVDWASIAAECGYFDQSHLIRDFHDFAEMTPSAYRPRSANERNHVALEG